MKKLIVIVALTGTMLGIMAHPALASGKPSYGCPPGFTGYTLEEDLGLPRTQAALTDGVYDVDFVTFIFESVDHNGDGIDCFQDVASLNGEAGPWAYLYNLVDNNASLPS